MLTKFDTGDGRTLSYLRRGRGPLVVCVPGGPGLDPEAYFAPTHLPGCEMLVFAPRGTGDSSPPSSPAGYRLASHLADLESLRNHLGLERMTLYGNSYGGSVVLAYACTYPQYVERFVISNAPARVDAQFEKQAEEARRRFAEPDPDWAKRVAAADQADDLQESDLDEAQGQRVLRTQMACSVAREGPEEASYLDRLCSAPHNSESVAGMWVEWKEGIDLLEHADRATAPALVIGGEADIVVPAAAVRPVADALPNARYLEIAGAGHFVAVEASEQFYAAVTEFLSD